MALIDNLISFWELEESSGTRVDSHDSHDFSPINTPGNASGKVGNAVDLEESASQYLDQASHADFRIDPSQAFSISAWIYVESFNSNAHSMGVLSKDDGGATREWILAWSGGTLTLQFIIFDNLGAPNFLVSAVSLSIVTWYHLVATFDGTTNMKLYINNGTAETGTFVGASAAGGTSHVWLGEFLGGRYFDGLIDQTGFWKRELTSGDVSTLYNGGAGLSYAAMAGGGGGGNPWYYYAQQRKKVERSWNKNGLIWTPSYSL